MTTASLLEEGEDPPLCPVCAERLDDTDLALFPCPCDYQICLWCLQRIRERENNKCPQCRREYNESQYRQIPAAKIIGNRSHQHQSSKKTTPKTEQASKHHNETQNKQSSGTPVICRFYGAPSSWFSAASLSQYKYLGKYGRLLSLTISSVKPSAETAFVAYAQEDHALLAIQDINKFASQASDPALRSIRMQMGASRLCIQSLRGVPCANDHCPFVHSTSSHDSKHTWKASPGRKAPLFPETQLLEIINDSTQESLFGKSLADLADKYPSLKVPPSAVAEEAAETVMKHPTVRQPQAGVVRVAEPVPPVAQAAPRRTWHTLKSGSVSADETLFPALGSQQPTTETKTEPPVVAATLVFLSPPPTTPWEEVPPPAAAAQISSAFPGMKVFAPPPATAVKSLPQAVPPQTPAPPIQPASTQPSMLVCHPTESEHAEEHQMPNEPPAVIPPEVMQIPENFCSQGVEMGWGNREDDVSWLSDWLIRTLEEDEQISGGLSSDGGFADVPIYETNVQPLWARSRRQMPLIQPSAKRPAQTTLRQDYIQTGWSPSTTATQAESTWDLLRSVIPNARISFETAHQQSSSHYDLNKRPNR